MKERELRKRCRRLLKELDIEPPLDVSVLCDRLGEQRGRPIRLMPYPLQVPGPFGCWIATPTADYIFYQQETTKSHQDHIVLHELGHMLADHHPVGDAQPGDFLPGFPLNVDTPPHIDGPPDIDRDAVGRALRRTSYDEAHEWEAETVATIVLEWASVVNYTIPQRAEDRDLRRIQSTLRDHQGWL